MRDGIGVAVPLIAGAFLFPPIAIVVQPVRHDRNAGRRAAALMAVTEIAPR